MPGTNCRSLPEILANTTLASLPTAPGEQEALMALDDELQATARRLKGSH